MSDHEATDPSRPSLESVVSFDRPRTRRWRLSALDAAFLHGELEGRLRLVVGAQRVDAGLQEPLHELNVARARGGTQVAQVVLVSRILCSTQQML